MIDDPSEGNLDQLLGRHLRTQLEPQVGRALEAFNDDQRHQQPWQPRRQYRLRRIAWATAIAATLLLGAALLWRQLAPAVLPQPHRDDGNGFRTLAMTSPIEAMPVARAASWSPLVDEGMCIVDDTPVRRLRRDVVQEIRYYDPQSRAMVRTTIPQQQVFYIAVRTD